jgi:hypothetical protein
MSIESIILPVAAAALLAAALKKRHQDKDFEIKDTGITDEPLLIESLKDLGWEYCESGSEFAIRHEKTRFILASDGQTFSAMVPHKQKSDEVWTMVNDLTSLYGRKLQHKVYQDILDRAPANGLVLEKEEVLDDNSVVMTFSVEAV